MPKQKKKKNNKKFPSISQTIRSFTHPGGSSTITNGERITPVHARLFITSTSSSITAGTYTLSSLDFRIANLGARIIALGDLFTYWRIVKMKFQTKIHPGAFAAYADEGNVTWMSSIVFAPSTTFTTPTTLANQADFPLTKFTQGHPGATLITNIGRKMLLSSMPYEWLKTTSTGVNDEDYIQLCFFLSSVPYVSQTVSGIADTLIDLDIEFRGDIDPALNPKSWDYLSRREFSFDYKESKEYKDAQQFGMTPTIGSIDTE